MEAEFFTEEDILQMRKIIVEKRRELPLEHQILRFLAEVGCATRRQIICLFEGKFDTKIIENEIKRITNLKRIAWSSINVPPHLDINLPTIKIYYAREEARAKLKTIESLIGITGLKETGRFGRLQGKSEAKLIRELLETESYLWFVNQGFEVVSFINQDHLKKLLGRKKWDKLMRERRLRGEPERNFAYKISIVDPQSWEFQELRCEIALKSRREIIMTKPGNLKWFCLTGSESRLVESITGEMPVVLQKFVDMEH